MQQSPTNGTTSGAVYVQTNEAPNEVIAFRRAGDGSLDLIGSVATSGDGDGSPHLTSQGSVALTRDGRHLLVTNAATHGCHSEERRRARWPRGRAEHREAGPGIVPTAR
jgi:hypothetical protein